MFQSPPQNIPLARYSTQFVTVWDLGIMFMYGGWIPNFRPLTTPWALTLNTSLWSFYNTYTVPSLVGGVTIYIAAASAVYVYGGMFQDMNGTMIYYSNLSAFSIDTGSPIMNMVTSEGVVYAAGDQLDDAL